MGNSKRQVDQENPTSIKRWNAYTCPDCRGIFRVSSCYAGLGVVCPMCDRMLRLPRDGDSPTFADEAQTAPHASKPKDYPKANTMPIKQFTSKSMAMGKATLRDSSSFAVAEENLNQRVTRDSMPYDQEAEWSQPAAVRAKSKSHQKSFFERYRFFVIFIGILMLILVIAIVGKGMQKPSNRGNFQELSIVPAPIQIPVAPVVVAKNEFGSSDIESIVRNFMNAESIDEMKKSIFLNADIERKIDLFYENATWEKLGFSSVDQNQISMVLGQIAPILLVTDRDFEEWEISLRRHEGRYLVDWESWVGWSQLSLDEILRSKPKTPVEVRVEIKQESYFNFDFPKEEEGKWFSYQLFFHRDDRILYGYVPSSGSLHEALRTDSDKPSRKLILRIRYPEESRSSNQVLIDSIVQEGWVTPE